MSYNSACLSPVLSSNRCKSFFRITLLPSAPASRQHYNLHVDGENNLIFAPLSCLVLSVCFSSFLGQGNMCCKIIAFLATPECLPAAFLRSLFLNCHILLVNRIDFLQMVIMNVSYLTLFLAQLNNTYIHACNLGSIRTIGACSRL